MVRVMGSYRVMVMGRVMGRLLVRVRVGVRLRVRLMVMGRVRVRVNMPTFGKLHPNIRVYGEGLRTCREET